MLDAIKFVYGAVSKKILTPALAHFNIRKGVVTASNGLLTLSSPIGLNIDANPRALEFLKAVSTCKAEIALHMTDAGRLGIKSGPFKAFVDCSIESFPEAQPKGPRIALAENFLSVLRLLVEFVADENPRTWSMGILFRKQSAYATNTVVLIEHWLGYNFPCEIVIPAITVREVLRIGEHPTHVQIDPNSITFHYTGDRWLHSVLYDAAWPDLGRILDCPAKPAPVPSGLFKTLRELAPFADTGRAYFHAERNTALPGHISTSSEIGKGADITLPGLSAWGCYNIEKFLLIEQVTEKIDLSTYPAPALFFGKNIRGAIIGLTE